METIPDCPSCMRTASLTTAPSEESAPFTRKSDTMSTSRFDKRPAASSDPAGPIPNARSSMNTPISAMKPPTA